MEDHRLYSSAACNRTMNVVIEGPSAGVGLLRDVQHDIAADLITRLANWGPWGKAANHEEPHGPQLRFGPGAGALLDQKTYTSLMEILSQGQDDPVSLPMNGFVRLLAGPLPCRAGTCFSVQTGFDLLALALHPLAPAAARERLDGKEPRLTTLLQALRFFTNRDAEVALVGPIRPFAWRYVEDEVACRVRVFADGGEQYGGLVAELYQSASPVEFLGWLREMGDAIFIDSRQLLAGAPAPYPSEEDFFWSDLGCPESVQHAGLRQLTLVALSADYPLVLGGASIVNGALFALVETAWMTGPDLDRGYQINW